MKIIYYSHTFFTDCDFPLIRELQKQGHDVRYYVHITPFFLKSSLLDLGEVYPHTGIFPASVYDGFKIYENEIDLSKTYVVNWKYKQKFHPANLLLMLKLVISFISQKADVIHLTHEPTMIMKLLYLIKKKLVLTVHDPFLHSSSFTKYKENNRKLAFKLIKKLVILNNAQIGDFINHYHIPPAHVFDAKLGCYDSICRVESLPSSIQSPYILFFGGISKYKGLDLLLEAMVLVHQKNSNLKLIVAGGGKLWFDISPYERLDYIDLRLHYIGVPELSGLLRDCKFVVCPYRDATQSGVVQTALSMCAPIIATRVGALPEVVINRKYGRIIEPNDVDSLAENIISLSRSTQELLQYKNNIKEEWIPSMSWRDIANKYIKCYQS